MIVAKYWISILTAAAVLLLIFITQGQAGGEGSSPVGMTIFARELESGLTNAVELVLELNNTTTNSIRLCPVGLARFERHAANAPPLLEHEKSKEKTSAGTANGEDLVNRLLIVIENNVEPFPLEMCPIDLTSNVHAVDPIQVRSGERMFLKLSIRPQLRTTLANAKVRVIMMRGSVEESRSKSLTLRASDNSQP